MSFHRTNYNLKLDDIEYPNVLEYDANLPNLISHLFDLKRKITSIQHVMQSNLDVVTTTPHQLASQPPVQIAAANGQNLRISLFENGMIKIAPSSHLSTPAKQHAVKQLPSSQSKVKVPEPAVEGDYSEAKPPTNQIPFTTFMGFCDQYLRNLTYADVQFLEDKVTFVNVD
jgi:hypothetical protein